MKTSIPKLSSYRLKNSNLKVHVGGKEPHYFDACVNDMKEFAYDEHMIFIGWFAVDKDSCVYSGFSGKNDWTTAMAVGGAECLKNKVLKHQENGV